MSISPRFVQELRDRLTLSEIIGTRVRLTRAGREFRGCCPFHREKTPSFHVNDEKQFFHCFGCGAHGDALGFVMRHDNLSFIEAIEQLAARAGMEVPRSTPQDKEASKRDKSLHALCDEAAKWFEDRLHDARNADVLSYLEGRGLSPDLIASFRLGYAPADDQGLRRHLAAQGYDDRMMIEAGLLKASTRGTDPYAFFRDRVIFPVTDARGRVVAFGGRVLPSHMRPPVRGDFTPPKYINSSDTPLFNKGRTLYAGQHARMAAKDNPIIVVEGYMDVLACHQAGFKGAVAPLGTALTEEQIELLWKMAPHDEKEPVLCFDGDEAGYRAAVRAADRVIPLLKSGHSVRFAFLPEGDDPDTYIREGGAEAFSGLLGRGLSLADFLWTHNTAGRNFQTPESRAGIAGKFDEIAAKIADRQVQYYYKQLFRERLYRLFGPEKGGDRKNNRKGAGPQNGAASVTLPPIGKRQVEGMIPRLLLLSIMTHPDIYPYVHEDLHRIDPDEEDLRVLQENIIDILDSSADEEGCGLDKDAVLGQITARGLTEISDRLLNNERLYVHAGFARPDVAPEKVLEGWKSLMSRWEEARLSADLSSARRALASAMTEENQSRFLALKHVQLEQNGERE